MSSTTGEGTTGLETGSSLKGEDPSESSCSCPTKEDEVGSGDPPDASEADGDLDVESDQVGSRDGESSGQGDEDDALEIDGDDDAEAQETNLTSSTGDSWCPEADDGGGVNDGDVEDSASSRIAMTDSGTSDSGTFSTPPIPTPTSSHRDADAAENTNVPSSPSTEGSFRDPQREDHDKERAPPEEEPPGDVRVLPPTSSSECPSASTDVVDVRPKKKPEVPEEQEDKDHLRPVVAATPTPSKQAAAREDDPDDDNDDDDPKKKAKQRRDPDLKNKNDSVLEDDSDALTNRLLSVNLTWLKERILSLQRLPHPIPFNDDIEREERQRRLLIDAADAMAGRGSPPDFVGPFPHGSILSMPVVSKSLRMRRQTQRLRNPHATSIRVPGGSLVRRRRRRTRRKPRNEFGLLLPRVRVQYEFAGVGRPAYVVHSRRFECCESGGEDDGDGDGSGEET